jgi:hypothetical protein
MALAPEGWCSIAEDERTQILLAPLIGFLEHFPIIEDRIRS